MFLYKKRHLKLNLLFFIVLNSTTISRVYGDSSPSTEKDKTQEVTSVMQESHVIKALKAQKSTTSVAICDYDGDDSHCPPITPEKNQFFIRTGTQMSCANSGAATFLKNRKLSYLSVEASDIIDQRSTASSLFNKNRSEESREKFSGAARVKVSLVAWTTAATRHERRYSSFGAYWTDGVPWNAGSFGFPSQHKDLIEFRIFQKKKSYLLWSDYDRERYRTDQTIPSHAKDSDWWSTPYAGWLLIKSVQNRYIEHFKTRQSGYKELNRDGLKKSNREGNVLTKYQPVGLTVLPPLSRQVHTIAYDDEVMANADDALLRCVNEGTKDAPSFFDADLDAHEKVCLSESQWREMKKTAKPAELAAHNKKLLYTYFKHIYGNQDKYKDWRGSSPIPKRTTTPDIAYSTYFAVQSCPNYAQDTENQTERKTAHQVLKQMNKEIENVLQLLKEGQKLTNENTELYRLFNQYGDHLFTDHKPNEQYYRPRLRARDPAPSVFDGKKALAASIFYWVFFNYKNVKKRYEKIISHIESRSEALDLKKYLKELYRDYRIIKQLTRASAESDDESGRSIRVIDAFDVFLSEYSHCFKAKRGLRSKWDRMMSHDNHNFFWWDHNGYRDDRGGPWYKTREKTLFSNFSAYSPRWWEHTDFGFVCKFISEAVKLKNLAKLEPLGLTFHNRMEVAMEAMIYMSRGLYGVPGMSYHFMLSRRYATPEFWNAMIPEDLDLSTVIPSDAIDKARRNVSELEKLLEILKAAAGLEVLEAKYQHYGPKNKACSPDTGTYKIKENKTPPDPAWHKVYSSAILDMRQKLDESTSKPFKIFSSQHPSEDFSTDAVKQHLMTKDSHYLTFYSSNPDLEENYHPGLPMIMVPGTDYIAPEVVADESSTPRRGYSGKYGISVYSYPPAVCNLATTQHRGIKRPHRIWK